MPQGHEWRNQPLRWWTRLDAPIPSFGCPSEPVVRRTVRTGLLIGRSVVSRIGRQECARPEIALWADLRSCDKRPADEKCICFCANQRTFTCPVLSVKLCNFVTSISVLIICITQWKLRFHLKKKSNFKMVSGFLTLFDVGVLRVSAR